MMVAVWVNSTSKLSRTIQQCARFCMRQKSVFVVSLEVIAEEPMI